MDEKVNFDLGTYKHYKGSYYTVLGLANDAENNLFVVYRSKNKPFALWIRPYEIFIQKVTMDETNNKPRFKKITSGKLNIEQSMTELLKILDDSSLDYVFTETETQNKYIITDIKYDAKSYEIKVHSLNHVDFSSYLTDFQLAKRMGYYLFICNKEKHIREINKYQINQNSFSVTCDSIPGNKNNLLEMLSNPCSIDLHIDDKCYYKTRFKKIDLTSLNIVNSQASDFWKKINFKVYHGIAGVKLRPHQSILTHTLEKIQIPSDCAGKIEIKSTYARLSLSVTNSDFCNPGWSGYYPLSIRNDGTNTVILHPREKMLQILLIPTKAPIINSYCSNSTYMNDDGTPFNFWRAKTVNALKTEVGNDDILSFFEKKRITYSGDMQERFDDTFIKFCEKNKHKDKYKNYEDKVDVNKIFNKYIKRERFIFGLLKFFNKFVTGFSALLALVVTVLAWFFPNPDISILTNNKEVITAMMVIFIIVFIVVMIASSKHYCTSKGSK